DARLPQSRSTDCSSKRTRRSSLRRSSEDETTNRRTLSTPSTRSPASAARAPQRSRTRLPPTPEPLSPVFVDRSDRRLALENSPIRASGSPEHPFSLDFAVKDEGLVGSRSIHPCRLPSGLPASPRSLPR